MSVPPPLRHPPLRKRRLAAIVGVSALAATALGFTGGWRPDTHHCTVCESSRDVLELGLYWSDDRLATLEVVRSRKDSPAYDDTLAAWGHDHDWDRASPRESPRTLFPGLVSFTYVISCPGVICSNAVRGALLRSAEYRRRVRALVEGNALTPEEVESALRACDLGIEDHGCSISRRRTGGVPIDVYTRLLSLGVETGVIVPRESPASPPASDGER